MTRKTYRNYGKADTVANLDVAPDSDWSELTYELPVREPTAASDVLVPLLQSLVTGLIAGAGFYLLLTALEVDVEALPAAAGTGLGCMAVTWVLLLKDTRRLLRRIETWTQQDLDGDGRIGPPRQESIKLEVKQDQKAGRSDYIFAELPVRGSDFADWCTGVLDGRSLAQSAWTGKGGPFSRSEYDELTDFLERGRVIEWVNPDHKAQGRKLTRMGEEALEAWLRSRR